MRWNPSDHTEEKGLNRLCRDRTHSLTVPLGKQEMSRSWRRVSPTCVQGARSILPRLLQRYDCSGRESRQTAFTGTSPAPGCKGSQISDLSSLPSSPEGNYLQETSQASRSTTSPWTSPTAALTLSGLWHHTLLWWVYWLSAQLWYSNFHLGKKNIVKGKETEMQISIYMSHCSYCGWAEVTDISRRRHFVHFPFGLGGVDASWGVAPDGGAVCGVGAERDSCDRAAWPSDMFHFTMCLK